MQGFDPIGRAAAGHDGEDVGRHQQRSWQGLTP